MLKKRSHRSYNGSRVDFNMINPTNAESSTSTAPRSLNNSRRFSTGLFALASARAEQEKLSKISIKSISSLIKEENSLLDISPSSKAIRQNANDSLKSYGQLKHIDFFEAISVYNSLEISGHQTKIIWKRSFILKLCQCFITDTKLDESRQEICEKLINFAYLPLSLSNSFDKNLMISAYLELKKQTDNEELEDILIEFLNKLSDEISFNSKILMIGLINVLFVSSFFPFLLDKMTEFYQSEFGMLRVFVKVSKLNLRLLRRGKMNSLLNRSQKCLEMVFFVFAGMMMHYFSYIQSENSPKKAYNQLLVDSGQHLEDLLNLSRTAYLNHTAQI